MGGGGIVPDVAVQPDTATEVEKEFYTAVSRHASKFNDVMLRYAVEFERRTPELGRDFQITPAMRDELHRRLVAAGVQVTREQVEAARRLIDARLITEIATSRFGPAVAAMRNDVNDRALQEAISLLQRSGDQAALFRAAEQVPAAQQQRASSRR